MGRGISRTGGTDRYNKNSSKVEEDEDSTNVESGPPADCSKGCTKADFTKAEKKEINSNIEKMSIDIRKATYGSYDAAALALHKSGLVEYFDGLGIEGWAVIEQESFSIKEVGTGFNSGFAIGANDGTFNRGDVVWHTHPSGDPAWVGDFRSAIAHGSPRIYASGRSLTYINSTISSIMDTTSSI